MNIKECMCNEVFFVSPETNIYEVSKMMDTNNIGSVLVCEQNKLCGIVTDRDIVLRGIACDKNVKEVPVKDIMSKKVCTCTSEDNIQEIENKMSENQIRRIPVCNQNNEPVGFISFGDIAKHCKEISNDEVAETIEKICCDSRTNTQNNA